MKRCLSKCWVLLVLAAVVGYATSVGGHTAAQPAIIPGPRLAFGQSVAFTDLDGDSVVDQATLRAVGFSKSIRVSLSTTRNSSVLLFTTSSSARGSLFAYDINNDGDVDLVWSDLIHPDDVVVWLNDGSGQFERVCNRYYASNFILGASGLGGWSRQTRELAASQPQPPAPDQIGRRHSVFGPSPALKVSRTNQCFRLPSLERAMAGRDPPSTCNNLPNRLSVL
jgi:hypothetical protein